LNAHGVLVGREVEMFELVPKVRQRQCIGLELQCRRRRSAWNTAPNRSTDEDASRKRFFCLFFPNYLDRWLFEL